MFGLMRVSTHERLLAKKISEYREHHEEIIDDLATNLWFAADDRTKKYIASTPGVTIRSYTRDRYGYRSNAWRD